MGRFVEVEYVRIVVGETMTHSWKGGVLCKFEDESFGGKGTGVLIFVKGVNGEEGAVTHFGYFTTAQSTRAAVIYNLFLVDLD